MPLPELAVFQLAVAVTVPQPPPSATNGGLNLLFNLVALLRLAS